MPQYLDDIVKSIYPMIQADANYIEMDVELNLGKPPIPTPHRCPGSPPDDSQRGYIIVYL